MREIPYILACIFLCYSAHSQSIEDFVFDFEIDSTVFGEDACTTAANLARRDFQSGKYAAFFHGYRPNSSLSFERVMLRDYGIYAMRTGLCTGDEFLTCYSEVSIPLIKERFGAEIFNIAYKKARMLDSIGEGDRSAVSPEDMEVIEKLFYCNITTETIKNNTSRKIYPKPYLTFEVTSAGEIIHFQVSNCENEELVNEIKIISTQLPKVQYATSDGEAIIGKHSLYLHLNRKRKKDICH